MLQGGAGEAPARQAAVGAGLPKEVPADTVNKVCASSVRAVEIAVAVNSARMLDADPETVNVNGGAVALGHPIGALGARILSTLVYELRRSGGGLGLAAISSGGGQGDAFLIEV